MDLNGDGHHDRKDDALLGFIASESENKKHGSNRQPDGPGCGTILAVFRGFCCFSALSALLR